jgi:hypothetical protein
LGSDPTSIASTVEDSPDADLIALNVVVDAKRESPRKQSIVTVDNPVNTGVEQQGVDIGVQRLEEVRADAWGLPLVECETGELSSSAKLRSLILTRAWSP